MKLLLVKEPKVLKVPFTEDELRSMVASDRTTLVDGGVCAKDKSNPFPLVGALTDLGYISPDEEFDVSDAKVL